MEETYLQPYNGEETRIQKEVIDRQREEIDRQKEEITK